MSSDEKEEAVEAEPTVVEAAPQRNRRGRKPYCKRRARGTIYSFIIFPNISFEDDISGFKGSQV